jgi:hypothetical protein
VIERFVRSFVVVGATKFIGPLLPRTDSLGGRVCDVLLQRPMHPTVLLGLTRLNTLMDYTEPLPFQKEAGDAKDAGFGERRAVVGPDALRAPYSRMADSQTARPFAMSMRVLA